MALHDDIEKLRAVRSQGGRLAVPATYQGVSKARIRQVLDRLDLGGNADLLDVVYALLDNETNSWFPSAPKGAKFADGASTAHIACHVGILQRGAGKLDREGRDYWIKPLRQLGAIEPITLLDGAFIPGHPIAKSSNSAYRLTEQFIAILKAAEGRWPTLLAKWSDEDATRQRQVFQAERAAAASRLVDNGHSSLIKASIDDYAVHFLPGYKVIYVDDGDGDRVTTDDKAALKAAGVSLELGDAMPDVLLWNEMTDTLWVIEAVTSDGEVDLHKAKQLATMAKRCGKAGINFTTTYRTWKEAALRQGTHRNIAVGTYIWIQADPAKHLFVKSFPRKSQ